MRFDLASPNLAKYHWGTLFCQFSAEAPVDRRSLLDLMASAVSQVANWKTDEEFRATAAMLHELAHLAQDLTTGLGHADFIAQQSTSSLLYYANAVIPMDGPMARPPYRTVHSPPWFEEDKYVAEVRSKLMYYPIAAMPQDRRTRLRALLEGEIKRPMDDEGAGDFSAQAILESDAALSVVLNLLTFEATSAQQKTLVRNANIMNAEMLGRMYFGPRFQVEAVLEHHAALSENALEKALPRVFGLMVDVALACPPASWVSAHDRSLDDFDPGVKFCRLLIAFQQLSGQSMDQFWSAIVHDGEMAEQILLEKSTYPYPGSREVYQAWVNELAPLEMKSTMARVRADACRFRLARAPVQIYRDVQLLMLMEAPVLLITEQGFAKLDWNARIIDETVSRDFTTELLDRFMISQLVEFLFRTGEFRCPHAIADTCATADDACFGGFVHLAQFPERKGCMAVATLRKTGVIV